MGIGTWDVPILDLSDTPTILKNGADYLNAHGGLGPNHNKVVVEPCNDKYNANNAIACARQAVSDKVIAVVGFSGFDNDIMPILEKAKIPRLGGLFGTTSNNSPQGFVENPGAFITWGPFELAASECKKTVLLLLNTGAPYTAANDAFYKSAFTAAGNPDGYVKTIQVPYTTTDMTPFLVQAEQSNPDCLATSLDTQVLTELIAAETAQGVIGKYNIYSSEPGVITSRFIAQNPAQTNGWKVVTFYQLGASNPAWQQYEDIQNAANDLGTYKDSIDNGTEEQEWVAWITVIDAAKKVSGDVTGAALSAALTANCSVNTGGLIPTLNFCQKSPYKNIERMFDQYMTATVAKNGVIEPYKGGAYYNVVDLWKKGGQVAIPAT